MTDEIPLEVMLVWGRWEWERTYRDGRNDQLDTEVECIRWKRLDSRMGSQSSAGISGQGSYSRFWQVTYPVYCGRWALWRRDGQTTRACWGNQNRDGKPGIWGSRRPQGDHWVFDKMSGRQVAAIRVRKEIRKHTLDEGEPTMKDVGWRASGEPEWLTRYRWERVSVR